MRVHAVSAIARLHARIGRQDHLVGRSPSTMRLELGHEIGAAGRAVVLDHDAAVLEVVHLQLPRDGLGVDAPRRDVRQVRARGRRLGVVRRVRLVERLDVQVALVGHGDARQVGRRAIGEVPDDGGGDHRDAPAEPRPRRRPAARPRRLSASSSLCSVRHTRRPSRPGGGSVWESNPPPTCLEPDAGFEVREAHRDPKRLRGANYPSDQRKECTTEDATSAPVSPSRAESVTIRNILVAEVDL